MSWKGRWYSLRARFSMAPVVILIRDGVMECVRGKLPLSMLKDFAELVQERHIDDALITVSKGQNATTFSFSSGVDESTKQRFRNMWFAYPERKIMGV